MSFQAFDKKKIEQYKREAKQQWGAGEAYKEYERKSAGRSAEEENRIGEGLMAIFAELGEVKNRRPDDRDVQLLVQKIQNYITKKFYPCTRQILAGLGTMYAAGGEMTDNINAVGGEGTAKFAAEAIKYYCK